VTRLVIVESPAKARTIAGYLGGDFVVESSVGHIRDLPNRASDVPKEQRAQFGKLGVDVENGFQPLYVVDADKKRVVSDLKQKLRDADELLLATDEDREGEAIAWHLREVLKPKVPVRRMVFHEITKDAIERALDRGKAGPQPTARRVLEGSPQPQHLVGQRGHQLAHLIDQHRHQQDKGQCHQHGDDGDDKGGRPGTAQAKRLQAVGDRAQKVGQNHGGDEGKKDLLEERYGDNEQRERRQPKPQLLLDTHGTLPSDAPPQCHAGASGDS